MARLTEDLIRALGIRLEVVHVSTLADARMLLGKSVQPLPYELAILDLHVSDGLGTELVETFRHHAPACKIIIYSGLIPGDARATSFVQGHKPDAMLGKPFGLKELREAFQLAGALP